MPNASSNDQTYDTCIQTSPEIDPERKKISGLRWDSNSQPPVRLLYIPLSHQALLGELGFWRDSLLLKHNQMLLRPIRSASSDGNVMCTVQPKPYLYLKATTTTSTTNTDFKSGEPIFREVTYGDATWSSSASYAMCLINMSPQRRMKKENIKHLVHQEMVSEAQSIAICMHSQRFLKSCSHLWGVICVITLMHNFHSQHVIHSMSNMYAQYSVRSPVHSILQKRPQRV